MIDSTSSAPVADANIIVVEMQSGTTTDSNGEFSLTGIVKGMVHLQVSVIGYETSVQLVNTRLKNRIIIKLRKSHMELSEVVVSTSNLYLQKENIARVENRKLSEIFPGESNLTMALATIPGVDNYSTGTGIGKPVIRGLSGNRIIVYSQNVRVENQQWGDEHGLGVNGTGVENVEVIKGPSSLLYGPDAIGGVIYFTDDKYAKFNSVEGHASTSFQSNTLGSYNDAGVKVNKSGVKFNVFGGYNSNADYELPDEGRATNTRFNEMFAKGSVGLTSSKWIGNIRYSFLRNDIGITEELSREEINDKSRDMRIPYQRVDNHLATMQNIFFFNDMNLDATIGFSQNNRKEFEEDPDIASAGFPLYR